MTSVQIIKHKKSKQKRKKQKSSCCPCFRARKSNSDISLDADFNEPYEYIVEKLVIKRVPVKRFSELKDAKSISSSKEVKPIVTFSSYCQMKPAVVNSGVKTKKTSATMMGELSDGDKPVHKKLEEKVEMKDEMVLTEISADGDKKHGYDSPREEMTSGRREQLQQCAKNLNTAQVYKHAANSPKMAKKVPPVDNTVLFTKPAPVKVKGKKELPPAVKETIDILATKQPLSSVNRRLVTRDPDTGQIKEIFQNIKIDKPLRLDEIYTQKEDATLDKKLPKWKIIIRHRDDKLKQKFEDSSSDLGIDSDVYSNKNII